MASTLKQAQTSEEASGEEATPTMVRYQTPMTQKGTCLKLNFFLHRFRRLEQRKSWSDKSARSKNSRPPRHTRSTSLGWTSK